MEQPNHEETSKMWNLATTGALEGSVEISNIEEVRRKRFEEYAKQTPRTLAIAEAIGMPLEEGTIFDFGVNVGFAVVRKGHESILTSTF